MSLPRKRGVAEREATRFEDIMRRAILKYPESYQELARRSGVNRASISRFMLGKRSFKLATAGKLCKELGLMLVRTKQ